jgi:hypothetical protein
MNTISHIKKPINLEAQSFIPENLKKQSVSSEIDLQGQTYKKEAFNSVKVINQEVTEK